MDRRRALQVFGTGLAAVAGCTSPGGDETTDTTDTTTERLRLKNTSFESELDYWDVGRDLPQDPNGQGPVASEVSTTTEVAADGDRALSLYVDGRQDDGTLWVQQQADLSTVSTLKVSAYADGESANTITKMAAFTGPAPGRALRESDFDTSQPVEDHSGWKTYEYPVDYDGEGLVAVGVSVVWETKVTRFLDDVRLA